MKQTAKNILSNKAVSAFLVLFAMSLFVGIKSPYFFTAGNFFNVLRQISIYGILAVAEALVIITGNIDLSVGYLFGLCGVFTAVLANANIPAFLILPLVMLFGALIGCFSGFLVAKVGISAFIATLGVQNICRGSALLITGGNAISYKSSISVLGAGYLGSWPISALIMFGVGIFFAWVMKYTQFGRNVFAAGSNIRSANLAGIAVDRVRITVFAICGALCGLCGIIQSGNLHSAEAAAGAGFELNAIAAVVIGGTSMAGGEGTIIGVLIGAAIMGILKNAFVLLRISAYWQIIVLGFVVILAVLADSLKQKRAER
ncbi:MAG: ABC transporter permease [Flexilinea sp.]